MAAIAPPASSATPSTGEATNLKASALLLALIAAWSGAGEAQPLAMRETGGVRHACGGVGAEERAALAGLRADANAELLFVHGKRGAYAAGVQVAVYEGAAAAPRLQVEAQGPICVLALPPGEYRIEARLGELVRAQRVKVSAGAGRPVRAVYVFPGLEWNGVRASEEEKDQARR